jgi:hypothetical protein
MSSFPSPSATFHRRGKAFRCRRNASEVCLLLSRGVGTPSLVEGKLSGAEVSFPPPSSSFPGPKAGSFHRWQTSPTPGNAFPRVFLASFWSGLSTRASPKAGSNGPYTCPRMVLDCPIPKQTILHTGRLAHHYVRLSILQSWRTIAHGKHPAHHI